MPAATETLQLVTFALAGDAFASDIFSVERVVRHVRPRPVPNSPGWLLGVIDHRDRAVPVVDLRARFELPPGPPPESVRIIVFEVEGQWIGAVVDAVREVLAVRPGEIVPPPPIFRGLTRDYVTGLLRTDAEVIVVLDITRLLTSQERIALDRSVQAAGD